MSSKNKKDDSVWVQTFVNEDNHLVTITTPINSMSKEHLQKAVYKCNNKMVKLHKQMMYIQELWEKLEESANKRGIELLEPDDKFCKDRRKAKNMQSLEIVK